MPLDEINELKERLVEQLSPVKIYLFGSYANGTNDEDSAFDFYIVVDDSHTDLIELTVCAFRSVRNIKKRPVDILVCTQSQFDERKNRPTVEREVFQNGILLYEA